MTAVQVYSDEPRYRAISRPATISRTIRQKLAMNTVATGTEIDKKLLDFSGSSFGIS
jgi:hypothetical protein